MERILIVTDDLARLCPTSQAEPTARALLEVGFSVRLIELNAQVQRVSIKSSNGRNQATIHQVAWKTRLDFTAFRSIHSLINDYQPDLIHAFGEKSAHVLTLAKPRRNKAPTIISHSSKSAASNNPWRWLKRALNERIDFHLIPHGSLLQQLEPSGSSHNQFGIMPWTVDLDSKVIDRDNNKIQVKKMLKIPEDAKLAGVAAMLHPRMRIKDVVWAADLVKCIRDDVYWLIIGDGPQRWRLERFAGQLDIGDNIRFLGWHELAPQLVAALDVYVAPSTFFFDFSGILAAMANGVPVVATQDPLHVQMVDHGKSGYLIEPGARNEFARCVNRLVNHPPLANHMGLNGKRKAQTQFESENRLTLMTDYYRQLTQRSSELRAI